MSTNNALCFLTVGLIMFGLPTLAPGFFPPHALFGSNSSALWLAFMGIVHGLLGGGCLFSNEVWPLVRPALAWPAGRVEWPTEPVEAGLPAGLPLHPDILLATGDDERASREAAA